MNSSVERLKIERELDGKEQEQRYNHCQDGLQISSLPLLSCVFNILLDWCN
jgi:hypothetical protein